MCQTRPRDKMKKALQERWFIRRTAGWFRTFRDIVHQYCKGHPWARFGIDLCIGSEADQPITQRQMMFAHSYLMDAFDGAQIKGRFYPVRLSNQRTDNRRPPEPDESGWMPTPLQCSLLLFYTDSRRHFAGIPRNRIMGDRPCSFGMAGIVGCVLAFPRLFSQTPGSQLNFLCYWFPSGTTSFLPTSYIVVLKRKKCWYLTLNLVVLTLFYSAFSCNSAKI